MLAAYLFIRYGTVLIADAMTFLYRNYGMDAVGAAIILSSWIFAYILYNKTKDRVWDERDDL